MRPLIVGFIFCIVLTVGGSFAIRLAGFHADWGGALAAMGAGIGALVLAALPLRLMRGLSQVGLVQAALAATVIHMVVMLMAAMIVIFMKLPVGSTFVFWLMGIYVITLVALVASIMGSLRNMTPTSSGTHA